MQVNKDTTVLYFVPSEEVSNVRVIIINETTEQDIYDEVVNLDKESYYYKLTDSSGFGFVDGESYILEVYEEGILVYRANLYSNSAPVRQRNQNQNMGGSNNEYLTI